MSATYEPGVTSPGADRGTDDYWAYAVEAAVALIRAAAERLGVPVEDAARRLAGVHGIDIG